MGRAKTVMEDDEPTEHACKMPSFIGSFEAEGRVKLSGNLPAETSIANGEAEVRDAERCVAATKSRLSSDEEEEGGGEAEESRGGEEEKDAEGNNNNNCNGGGGGGGGGEERRRASALEILRRNFGVSRPSSARLSSSGRMQLDPERESDENSDVAARHGSEKSEGETGDAATQNEPTASEPTSSDVHGVAGRCRCEGDGHATGTDAHLNGKDHVYCTVYCIANDSRRTDAELPQGDNDAAERGEAPPPGGEQPEARPDTDPSPEPTPYTLDDLVDPFADMAHWPYTEQQQQQGGANTATQLCWVCLDEKTIAPLPCCKKAVCDECLKLYVSSQVRGAKLYIGCPIPECNGTLDDVMVTSHLASEDLAKYRYFLELSQLDSSTKPCPQCSEFTSLKKHNGTRSEHKYKIQCSNCHFLWCFKCHAPWHNGLKCREYRKGDKLLRSWASVIEHGQRNAQKCPQCKIHIQRTEGCDHMTCMQCSTNFCYRCGERYRHLRFFGDHTSNLSVFGCKYRYLPDKPNLRRLIRGSVCGVKVLIAPVVILLVVVVGALAVVIGLVVFPVYYVCKRRKKQRALGSGRWI